MSNDSKRLVNFNDFLGRQTRKAKAMVNFHYRKLKKAEKTWRRKNPGWETREWP